MDMENRSRYSPKPFLEKPFSLTAGVRVQNARIKVVGQRCTYLDK